MKIIEVYFFNKYISFIIILFNLNFLFILIKFKINLLYCLNFCKEDQADKEKFIKWWFTDYLTIYNELHPPVKKEKKNKKEEQKNNA